MKKTNKILLLTIIVCVCANMMGCAHNNSIDIEFRENVEHRRQRWLKAINWDNKRLNYSGKNIKIAVIDSGIDKKIPELNGKIEIETTVVKEKEKADVKHETAVASIISAESHSDNQVSGIAQDAKIVSIDVTNQSDGIVDVNDLINGINRAIEYNVDIINVSVGILTDDNNLEKAIQKRIMIKRL